MQIRVFPVSTENFLNAKPHFLLWSRNCRFHLLIIAVFSSTLREQRSILQLNIYFHFPAYGGLNHSNIRKKMNMGPLTWWSLWHIRALLATFWSRLFLATRPWVISGILRIRLLWVYSDILSKGLSSRRQI